MLTRKVTDFIKLEEGNISRKSALTVGSLLALVAGSAGVAHGGEGCFDYWYCKDCPYPQQCAYWCTDCDDWRTCSLSHCC